MFLALKEIKKEKLRSGLIVGMIALIAYLIFILTSLALGMIQQNTAAINSWDVQNVTLNKNANVDMRQSVLTKQQASNLSDKEALIGDAAVVAKASGHKSTSAAFIGVNDDQFIAKELKLESGHRVKNNSQVVVDDAFKLSGYKLGDQFKVSDTGASYKIVGFTKNAKLNVSPVIYGTLASWRKIKAIPGVYASAIVSKDSGYSTDKKGLKTYATKTLIDKLPGYSAQNLTFGMMIIFLMLISLIVIAVFLYILTMQKLPNYAVLRAQGIPSKVLVGATVSQSLLLVLGGLILSGVLTAVTAIAMPANVPMAFNIPALLLVALALLVMSILGSLIPVRTVLKVDPVSVIGG